MKKENEYIVGDNLTILSELNYQYDFCYIDPPYCTQRDFGDFNDNFDSMEDFIKFLRPRIELIHKKLSKTGNLVVHIDSIASHYVKVMIDEVFGIDNFKNEIILQTNNMKSHIKTKLMRSHDVLLVYSKSKDSKYFQQYTQHSKEYISRFKKDERGYYTTSAAKNSQPNVIKRPNLRYEWNGNKFQWWVSKEKMKELHEDNRLVYNTEGIPRIKRYLHESKGIPMRDIWYDIPSTQSNEKLDYATQKPINLLNRLLELYTEESDLCLDIFAGSGVLGRSCIEKSRQYHLIDINPKGKEIFEQSIPDIEKFI